MSTSVVLSVRAGQLIRFLFHKTQRQLKNHPKIVNMIEASVADLPGGVDGSKGYEIYILMEWCAGE